MANDKGTFTAADAPTVTDAYTASATDINVQKWFEQFGYYPTQAEVTALGGSFSSANDAASKQFGVQAISQYVLQQKQNADFAKNDPLAALQTRMEQSVDTMKKQVTGLYGQLQDVLGSAPQLFGNLTPDQITGYLAPLQTAFKTQLDVVQGAMGNRGLWGSSTEANALAQTGQQFQEKVFSTGLDVGMQSQQAKAKAISDQINSLLGLTGTEEQISGAAAGQRSKQNLGQSNLVASLPFFLQQAAQQAALTQKQLNSGGGFMDTFNQVTGGINSGVNAFQSLMMVPGQFKTSPGGAPQTPGAPNPAAYPSFPQGSSSPSAPLFASSATPGYTPADASTALFAAP